MAAGDDSSVNLATPTGSADTRKNAAGEERQVVIPGNAGDAIVGMDVGAGSLNVNLGPSTLFYESWSSLDTIDKWTVTGTTPSLAGGNMTMSSAAGYNALRSKPTMPATLGYHYVAMGFKLETTAASGATRYWGLGTAPSTPSATSMAQEGVGFEVDSTGTLYAVTYTNGARTPIAALPPNAAPTGTGANASATVPNYRDAGWHRYAFEWRVTGVYWYVDNLQIPVASATFPSVGVQELPAAIARFNGTITGTPVWDNIAVAVGDTARMGQQIVDANIPTRAAKVSKTGHIAIGGTSVVGISGAIAAGATGTIGPVDVTDAGNVTFVIKNTVAASAWAGTPVVVFEQSDDNVSWSPLLAKRDDTGVPAGTHVLAAGTANAELMFDAGLEGVTYVRARVTTGPTTNGFTIAAYPGTMLIQPHVGASLNPSQTLPVGTATGTVAASTNQVGRPVRVTSTAAFATAQTLIAAPGAGLRIYVTSLVATNEGSTLTVIRAFAGSAPVAATTSFVVANDIYDMALAASGGGAALPFDPAHPWPLPTNTALSLTVSAATTWDLTVNYYIAP